MSTSRPALPSPAEIALLPKDGGEKYNRLIFAQSPYLLQHAANPVDWYPWGDDAFEAARKADKPIFLSIGYATCHWCHVMEHESFEDAEVAALMNDHFICVKVDREERPDVDHIYMTVCQALTGHGGWPLTIVMTPDRRPFFAGTYFPKNGRQNRPGMMQLVPAIGRAWREQRQELLSSSERITNSMQSMSEGAGGGPEPGEPELRRAAEGIMRLFDERRGGIGTAPKFPTPHQYGFLLRWHLRSGDPLALEVVTKTLVEMRRGGIFDQIGYGFHRYSTDVDWLVPHFEKMLYDQALLLGLYAEAAQVTGDDGFARVAAEIVEYVNRDMRHPDGPYYSAEDADSEGEEGRFYVWTTDEVRRMLNADDANFIINTFNLSEEGNFREEATGQRTGTNIPHLRASLAQLAAQHGTNANALGKRLDALRLRLLEARAKRVRPLLDDKVLTDWNGLMIAGLAKAGRALQQPAWMADATRAANWVLDNLRETGAEGRLFKRARGCSVGLPGLLDDYAFMVMGLIELHQATQEHRYLGLALELNAVMLRDFWDEKRGGLFMAPEGATDLIVRAKEIYDGALPSGNSVAAMNLLRLARLTGRSDLELRAREIFHAFSGAIDSGPRAHTFLLQAVDALLHGGAEVVLVGDSNHPDMRAMRTALDRAFLPDVVVLVKPSDDANAMDTLKRLAPYTAGMTAIDGRPTAYVCRNQACQAPVFSPMDVLDALKQG